MNAILRSLAIIVGIPTVLATVYFGFLASDVYVSESRFAIRSAKGSGSASGLAAILSTPIVSSGAQESLVVADYVHSQDMLQGIQERLAIDKHYSSGDVDWLARLPKQASQEETLEYFIDKVELVRDSASDVLTLRTRAYDPQTAQKLGQLVVELSENLVNTMSQRIEDDALDSARDELDRAVEKVRVASADITQFRNQNASLNPTAESSALLGIVTGIESKLVEARAELSEKRAYMRDTSPDVITLKNRVNALSRQLRLEKGRVVGAGGQEMSGLIEGYQPLVLEQELAQQQYASALTSLEVARAEAQRKKQYLITFIQPNLPEQALEPRRVNEILTVMVFCFLFYAVGALMWSALKDHIGR
jgi:capsular polysaccharide transport system permease protein